MVIRSRIWRRPSPRLGGRASVRAILLLALLIPIPARAEIEAGDLTLTVTPERNGDSDPFAREMVLLRIRGVYKQAILLEELVQPSLANFSWTQLGRDRWGKTKLPDGQNAISFDRTIAVFPHHAGDFTIEPFTHRLTVNDSGERRVIAVGSQPVVVPVAPWPEAAGGPDAKEPWWLPAHDVTITDSWSPDPETVKVGESTRRIVVLEAQGVVAEGLPPRPVMRTRGILTFAGPVVQETLITPKGPVARATYRWDVTSGVSEVIPLDAIAIPWFDTATRTMREAEIPARQIGGGVFARDDDATGIEAASPLIVGGVGIAAFVLAITLIEFAARGSRLRLPARSREALRRAARADDPRAFRAALDGAGRAPELAHRWAMDPAIAAELMRLDRTVYAPAAPGAAPDLSRLAKALARPVPPSAPVADSPLKLLDGPISAGRL